LKIATTSDTAVGKPRDMLHGLRVSTHASMPRNGEYVFQKTTDQPYPMPRREESMSVFAPLSKVSEKSVVSLLLDSCVWMASSLASLIPFVQLSAQVPIDWRPFWAGFFEVLVVYTVDHLRDIRMTPVSSDFMRKAGTDVRLRTLKALSIFGIFGFFASVAAAPPSRHHVVFLTFGVHLLLCVAYARLKPRMPYLKAAYVSLCVVFMAVAAPAAYDPSLLAGFSSVALLRLLLLIMSVSFTIENLQDLRDIKEDREAGVVTLPSGLGVEWTARLLTASQIGCIIFQFCVASIAAVPLRIDMLAIHILCILCALGFNESTPPCLFQVVLEPLYMSPVALLVMRAAFVGG
jgi:hypothetical protein